MPALAHTTYAPAVRLEFQPRLCACVCMTVCVCVHMQGRLLCACVCACDMCVCKTKSINGVTHALIFGAFAEVNPSRVCLIFSDCLGHMLVKGNNVHGSCLEANLQGLLWGRD